MSMLIQVDAAALRDVEQRLGQFANRAPNAIANSLNRASTNTASNITKETRSKYHLKPADIKATLKITKASKSVLSAEVRSSGEAVPLDRFKVSPKTVNPKRKSQLKIAVKKNGMKQVLGAFVANLHGIKLFKRETNKRLPIARLFGPSIPQMIGNEETVRKINEQSWITYETRLNHEINRILGQLGAS
ncbi:phage tail protein [Lysinibacillus sp. FSL M8-0134]|uniref:phage tail protein n=1 Tax=Lysinibacillus sp. FSL M8-0134 TaxID=2921717 RepID=UPI00311A23E8